MKRLFYNAISFVMMALAVSCGGDNNPLDDGNHRVPGQTKGNKYTVALSLGGDYVDETDEPLSRVGESGNTYVGVNVTRKKIGSNTVEKFAYGVFTDRNRIFIDVFGGYLYDFEVTALVDGTDMYKSRHETDDLCEPFQYGTLRSGGNVMDFDDKKIGVFQYTSTDFKGYEIENEMDKEYLPQLAGGKVHVLVAGSPHVGGQTCYYPRVRRYYGVVSSFDPSANSKEINVNMDYKCFGIKVNIEKIPEGTYLTWEDVTAGRSEEKENLLLFPDDLRLPYKGSDGKDILSWEDVYSFSRLVSSTSVSDTFTIRFTWHKGEGQGDVETFVKSITVRPQVKKVLNISIEGNGSTKYEGLRIVLSELTDKMQEELDDISYSQSK